MRAAVPALLIASLSLAACGETAKLSIEKGQGANPELPAPNKTLIPTVKVADAVGWAAGEMPIAAPGLTVTAFASNLDHPRWVYVLPNGDVLVAETNAPPKPEDGKGIKGFVMGLTMKKAGAVTKSANRLTLLRDADGDGVAEVRTVFVSGLNSPFGMALVGDRLYIANADAVVSVPYATGDLKASAAPQKLTDLPGGPINHHWTKSLVASKDGKFLYAGIGSNSNVAENGIAAEKDRAAILQIDVVTGARTVYASGLRNPVGMDWNPASGALWVAVNERDEIGSDLVPDYMTSVTPGAFYGWPYSYYGQHVDARVKPQNPELVKSAIKPDYALGPHTASLGFSFYTADLLAQYKGGALIGQHGSWNRNPPSGYKVVFVPFNGATPAGPPQDVLTGFRTEDGKAKGRPVGVTVDAKGAILVADDVGNIIWRVAK
ncbi:sorbosone dehydrogenase family protein [Asticcacaulis sp. YBE204]|uniref:PQQ-dependent sugar dehydrogenase n=1 Tax=Asticcacaulis sp. YBE204 TaxID=1282363 RepID=UPI0003C41162|nr:sorbosone dehydrogenase family protein [Asticcacaulis sp. YBE204]ESQ80220.1 hypothetical protein AEYBE204_06260 [Asticcacaulis sp. YBE204]